MMAVGFPLINTVQKRLKGLYTNSERLLAIRYKFNLITVVYKFICSSCQATHYEKTSRHFIVRCIEHLGVNKQGKSVKGVSSSIRDHINETGHSASINSFSD